MNGNRIIVYREFVGVTPVAKTLRNELETDWAYTGAYNTQWTYTGR